MWVGAASDPAGLALQKNKAQVNDEAKEQGRAYACGACQTIARVVGTMVGSKMKEKEMKDFFMEMCDTAEPSKRLNPEDTKVICRSLDWAAHRVLSNPLLES